MGIDILNNFHAATVIPVSNNWNLGLLGHSQHHPAKVLKDRVAYEASTKGNNNRSVLFLSSVDNTHEHFGVPYVEVRDCELAFLSLVFPEFNVCKHCYSPCLRIPKTC